MLYNWNLNNRVNQIYFNLKKSKKVREIKIIHLVKFSKKSYGLDIKHYFPCWGGIEW